MSGEILTSSVHRESTGDADSTRAAIRRSMGRTPLEIKCSAPCRLLQLKIRDLLLLLRTGDLGKRGEAKHESMIQ